MMDPEANNYLRIADTLSRFQWVILIAVVGYLIFFERFSGLPLPWVYVVRLRKKLKAQNCRLVNSEWCADENHRAIDSRFNECRESGYRYLWISVEDGQGKTKTGKAKFYPGWFWDLKSIHVTWESE